MQHNKFYVLKFGTAKCIFNKLTETESVTTWFDNDCDVVELIGEMAKNGTRK